VETVQSFRLNSLLALDVTPDSRDSVVIFVLPISRLQLPIRKGITHQGEAPGPIHGVTRLKRVLGIETARWEAALEVELDRLAAELQRD
jgi:hypothetical protein